MSMKLSHNFRINGYLKIITSEAPLIEEITFQNFEDLRCCT
ncbi:hypothetical protein T12_12889 [Trichinella patagoniensis]|uniref:Uncharacterized protein n=1 Tax=Trichinella patagoniensis TaxID=990121 RepID=A0A0V0Z5A8_9BILA|nr:hypothetical protein T12_12889 [Trichinella patagoniensis]